MDFLDFRGDSGDELGLKFDWWDSVTSLQKPHFQTQVYIHFKNFRLRRLPSYLINHFAIYCSLVYKIIILSISQSLNLSGINLIVKMVHTIAFGSREKLEF